MKKIVALEEGLRLDSYLHKEFPELSRTMIKKMLEEEVILVNGEKQKPSYRIKKEDYLEINEIEAKETNLKPQQIPLEILYEDKDIVVINKAKGMVVHPGNGNPEGTLANAVLGYCKDSLSGIGGEIRPGIVHRLDKDTSGVIIIAKNDKAHLDISEQIKKHETQKTYLALVRGIVKEKEATINMPIARSTKDRTKMAVAKEGKNAITHFTVLERYQNTTLLKIVIETGRTHQIRVHMAEIGHPVIGDGVYSNGKNEYGIQGQMLHAWKIAFKLPKNGERLEIVAPVPEYFKKIIESEEKKNGRNPITEIFG